MNRFEEYMWYLLITPLKKIKKSVNHWYIWCRVLGRCFNECKEDLMKSREEGMVATSSRVLLMEHGVDRGLVRYAGEDIENFRSRVSMHEELCRLGGVNQGIILAVKTLGYDEVTIISAKDYKGDPERWAEFYVLLPMSIEQEYPIGYDILKKNVRIWKEVGAKDNYQFIFQDVDTIEKITDVCRGILMAEAGNKESKESKITFRITAENQLDTILVVEVKNNLWYLNGSYNLNGTKLLNAYEKTEDL